MGRIKVGEIFFLLLAGLLGTATAQDSANQPSKQSPVIDRRAASGLIAERTSEFRTAEGLSKLHASEALEQAARRFARFMAGTGKYGHTADDKQPWDRAAEQGYEACIVAENIGQAASSKPIADDELAGRLVQGWKDSKTHRANLLDPDLTETGIAVAQSESSGKYYAVQLFGRPKSQSIHVEIANRAGALVKYKVGEQELQLDERAIRTHELCRPTDISFTLPRSEGDEQDVKLHVQSNTRLAIERDKSREIVVTVARGVER